MGVRGQAGLAAAVALGVTAACGAKTGLLASDDAPLRCTELDARAGRSPLDVFIMLDTSKSMARQTADGQSKAEAMRDALAAFFAEPASAGIGVGEAFFPILQTGVPNNCTADSECGAPGACNTHAYGLCWPSGEAKCMSAIDCKGTSDPSDKCAPLGSCGGTEQVTCLGGVPEAWCPAGTSCVLLGFCTNRASCNAKDYSALVVGVGTLPGARSRLLLALDTQASDGGTPTLPALQGVLSAAEAWQTAHAGHKAIVLLATDGLPTVCDPAIPLTLGDTMAGIPAVVDAAKHGVEQGVQTFVVGVFSPQEQSLAEAALDDIATGGGSDKAVIVTTDVQVSTRLASTFDAIRRDARACDYSIPWPPAGGIDPASLSVTVDGAAVARVASSSACGSAGGFYFDRDPQPGKLPHRVILCPATCGTNAPSSVHMKGACGAGP